MKKARGAVVARSLLDPRIFAARHDDDACSRRKLGQLGLHLKTGHPFHPDVNHGDRHILLFNVLRGTPLDREKYGPQVVRKRVIGE